MSFLMQLDSDMFIDLVFKAIEMDVEEKIWDKWLAELPNMSEESLFHLKSIKQNISNLKKLKKKMKKYLKMQKKYWK